MNDWERQHRQAQRYKDAYPPGTRIVLNHMSDPYHPVPEGMRGTVRVVDDMGTYGQLNIMERNLRKSP